MGDEIRKLGGADAIDAQSRAADLLGQALGRLGGVVIDLDFEKQVGARHVR